MNTRHRLLLAASLALLSLPVATSVGCTAAQVGALDSEHGASRDELRLVARDAGAPRDVGSNIPSPLGSSLPSIKTVFLIMMENHNLSQIVGSASAPYLNGTLLPQGALADNYFNPAGLHPSEPNYIWLEAGDNMGISTDADPSARHSIPSTDHLTKQLHVAGKSWKAYAEGISGAECPIVSSGLYAAKHIPFLYFQDFVGAIPSATSADCIRDVRPLTELVDDLRSDTVADYNVLVPNLCNDMHGANGCPSDSVKSGDDWLRAKLPQLMASEAYSDNGAILITFDESEHGDHPIVMLALSPLAKRGYVGHQPYTHSTTLRTVEELFSVPALRGASTSNDLADLFLPTTIVSLAPTAGPALADGHFRPLSVLTPGVVLTTDAATICRPGYTATVRNVPQSEKQQVAASYNYTGANTGVEYDHLISLELGGANDAGNLWPEPIADAHVKDGLENYLHAQVCAGRMSLGDVQARIARDWVQLWNDVGRP